MITSCNGMSPGGTQAVECNNGDYLSTGPLALALQWRHNEYDGVSNHQSHDCLLNGLFRRRSKRTPKLRVTGLCAGNSPVTGEFPAQKASNEENVPIWWRHHDKTVKFESKYNTLVIFITENAFENVCKVSAILFRPRCDELWADDD